MSQLSVVSLPQAAAETPFVSGKFPVFSSLTWSAYFHLLVGKKNLSSSIHTDELWDWETSFSDLWAFIHLQTSWQDLTYSVSPHPPPVSAPPWVQLAKLAPIPSSVTLCTIHSSLPCQGAQNTPLDLHCPLQISPPGSQVKTDDGEQIDFNWAQAKHIQYSN